MSRFFVFMLLVTATAISSAQIYRWTDAQGRTTFSNAPPPKGVSATVVDANPTAGPPAPDTGDCHTIRCQGERLEERTRKRQSEDERIAAERAARAPKAVSYRGLDFRNYISIQRGMSEGELLGIAGEPDLKADQGIAIAAPSTIQVDRNLAVPARTGLSLKTWTYMPTSADPFTTTITLVGGRVTEIDRVRKF